MDVSSVQPQYTNDKEGSGRGLRFLRWTVKHTETIRQDEWYLIRGPNRNPPEQKSRF